MTYASGRRYQDADSHPMELPDFMSAHAERSIGDRLPSLAAAGLAIEGVEMATHGGSSGHPREVVERLVSLYSSGEDSRISWPTSSNGQDEAITERFHARNFDDLYGAA